jgi:NTE family protein
MASTEKTIAAATKPRKKTRLGVALGSGSARGWAHIGVLRALHEMGISPDIIVGTSAGALVGGSYVSGQLDALESWARSIGKLDVVRMMDIAPARGGVISGSRLFDAFRRIAQDVEIEKLPLAFTAVATDFATGREIWLQEGSLHDAVRASISVPGLFSPFSYDGSWLVDGGLVNPVPISVCRAMGADHVIGVNLSGDLADRNTQLTEPASFFGDNPLALDDALARLPPALRERIEGPARFFLSPRAPEKEKSPGFFDVIAGSINIMQDRVTRSRMAGDPADILIEPRLEGIRLLDFDHAREAIMEGHAATERMRSSLERLVNSQEG